MYAEVAAFGAFGSLSPRTRFRLWGDTSWLFLDSAKVALKTLYARLCSGESAFHCSNMSLLMECGGACDTERMETVNILERRVPRVTPPSIHYHSKIMLMIIIRTSIRYRIFFPVSYVCVRKMAAKMFGH